MEPVTKEQQTAIDNEAHFNKVAPVVQKVVELIAAGNIPVHTAHNPTNAKAVYEECVPTALKVIEVLNEAGITYEEFTKDIKKLVETTFNNILYVVDDTSKFAIDKILRKKFDGKNPNLDMTYKEMDEVLEEVKKSPIVEDTAS